MGRMDFAPFDDNLRNARLKVGNGTWTARIAENVRKYRGAGPFSLSTP
jgi:hypothetical protein